MWKNFSPLVKNWRLQSWLSYLPRCNNENKNSPASSHWLTHQLPPALSQVVASTPQGSRSLLSFLQSYHRSRPCSKTRSPSPPTYSHPACSYPHFHPPAPSQWQEMRIQAQLAWYYHNHLFLCQTQHFHFCSLDSTLCLPLLSSTHLLLWSKPPWKP